MSDPYQEGSPVDRPIRDAAIEALFAPFDVRAFVSISNPALIAELHDDEAGSLSSMAEARRAEFATARACARAALQEVGIDAAVPRSEGGAPQWPDGTAGSISHTRGFCLAIVSRDAPAVGIDVEQVARMKPAVERRILIDAERELIEQLPDADRRQRVATIFAAKEAFYKAHYEVDARYLGFDAVHVSVEGDTVGFGPASGEVEPQILQATTGRFRVEQGRVIVGVAIDVTGGPSPLRSPA